MPDSPQPPKIGLDARAAELKEKLLRSRGQSQNRASLTQPPPDGVRASPAVPAPTPPKASSSARPISERAKASNFIPHEVPRPPVLTSLPADANDIAALISSISSAVSAEEMPEPNKRDTAKSDVQQMEPAQKTTSAREERPLPHKTPSIVSQPVTSAPTTPTAPASQATPLPEKRAPRISIPLAPQSKQAEQPVHDIFSAAKPPLSTRRPVNASPEEGDGTGTPQKNGASRTTPTRHTARATPRSLDLKKSLTATTSHANGISPTAPIIDSRAEPARGRTDHTPPQLPPHSLPGDGGHSSEPQTASPMPKTVGTSTETGQTATSSKETAHPEPISSEDVFTRLLSQAPDLKDFLEMTGYFDVETRTRKLDRFRRVKALAAEKLRIEEEERKLMEEEELELGLQRSTVARLTGTVTSALAGSETSGLLTPATPMFAGALPTPVTPVLPGPKIDAPETAPTKPAKRAHDDDSSEPRQKVPRLEPPPPPPSRPAGIDNKTQEDDQRDRKLRDASPPRRPYPPSSPGRDDRYRRSPPPRPRSRQSHDDYDSRPRYNRYKDDGSERRRDSGGQPVSYPIHVDLGRKGGQYCPSVYQLSSGC